jgi:hypothetical protein
MRPEVVDLPPLLKPHLLVERLDIEQFSEVRLHPVHQISVNILGRLLYLKARRKPILMRALVQQRAVALHVYQAAGTHKTAVALEKNRARDPLRALLILWLGVAEGEPNLADLTGCEKILNEFDARTQKRNILQTIVMRRFSTAPKSVALDIDANEVALRMPPGQSHRVLALSTAQFERDRVVVSECAFRPYALVHRTAAHDALDIRFVNVGKRFVICPFLELAFAHFAAKLRQMFAQRPHLLFVVLDWGLGHATRTFPLISQAAEMLGRGELSRVSVASSGAALDWLELHVGQSHPAVLCFEKPGADIRYSKYFKQLKLVQLLPTFLKSLRKEQIWCQSFCSAHGVSHIVSDNCYGGFFRDPSSPQDAVHSAIITHQLSPALPYLLRPLGRWIVHRWLAPFHEIWVPDWANARAGAKGGLMAGAMAAPLARDAGRTTFVGPLSRFDRGAGGAGAGPEEAAGAGARAVERKYTLVASVSGPAPHRGNMEAAARSIFLRDGRPAVIFAGQPSAPPEEQVEQNVTTIYNPSSRQIRAAFLEAEVLICRSGYTTLMDLTALGKTAILVPTPGQPEQLALAKRWSSEFGWRNMSQTELSSLPEQASSGRIPAQLKHPGKLAFPTDAHDVRLNFLQEFLHQTA